MSSNRGMSRREFGRMAAGMVVTSELAALGGSALFRKPAFPDDVLPRGASKVWPKYGSAMVVDFLATPGPFNAQARVDALTPEMVRNAAESGITAVNLTIGGADPEGVFRDMAKWERDIRAHPDVLMNVRSVADLETARRTKRLGIIYGFQDGVAIGKDLSRVDLYKAFGLRIVQLTYNVRNMFGDGCLQPENGGLTPLGHDLVAELNAKRVIVDLGHVGQKTTADAIEASKVPVAISHSACRAVADRPRSKRDEELRRMAEKGGVVGIYLMPFLTLQGQPSSDDLIRHIEHALKVCGEDHVGIGSDLSITPHKVDDAYLRTQRAFIEQRMKAGISAPGEDPAIPMFVTDLNSPRRMEMIADRLLSRGHSEARVEKIVGGNFARLMKEVWGA